jgi:ankyrin repeat protein
VHNRQPALAAYLADFADVFDALQCGMLGRAARLLQANPDLAHARDRQGRPLACLLRDDLQSLDAAIALLRGHGVDLDARDDDGRTAVDRAMASGDYEFAARLRTLGLGGGS